MSECLEAVYFFFEEVFFVFQQMIFQRYGQFFFYFFLTLKNPSNKLANLYCTENKIKCIQ